MSRQTSKESIDLIDKILKEGAAWENKFSKAGVIPPDNILFINGEQLRKTIPNCSLVPGYNTAYTGDIWKRVNNAAKSIFKFKEQIEVMDGVIFDFRKRNIEIKIITIDITTNYLCFCSDKNVAAVFFISNR